MVGRTLELGRGFKVPIVGVVGDIRQTAVHEPAQATAYVSFGRYRVPLHFGTGGETERVNGDMVTGSLFEVLGLRAAHGRLLGPDDDRAPSGHPVVVLGYAFFERRFGSDRGVVGRVDL